MEQNEEIVGEGYHEAKCCGTFFPMKIYDGGDNMPLDGLEPLNLFFLPKQNILIMTSLPSPCHP